MAKKKQPMQPIGYAESGVIRFKANAIVDHLITTFALDLNELAALDFSNADRSQLAQLSGYSVSGWGDLSYATSKTVAKADAITAELHHRTQETGLEEPKTVDLAHPMQPIFLDDRGVARFQPNAIITWGFTNGRVDLNALATLGFPDQDWEQLAQLLGYSVDGFADLSYVSDDVVAAADASARSLIAPG